MPTFFETRWEAVPRPSPGDGYCTWSHSGETHHCTACGWSELKEVLGPVPPSAFHECPFDGSMQDDLKRGFRNNRGEPEAAERCNAYEARLKTARMVGSIAAVAGATLTQILETQADRAERLERERAAAEAARRSVETDRWLELHALLSDDRQRSIARERKHDVLLDALTGFISRTQQQPGKVAISIIAEGGQATVEVKDVPPERPCTSCRKAEAVPPSKLCASCGRWPCAGCHEKVGARSRAFPDVLLCDRCTVKRYRRRELVRRAGRLVAIGAWWGAVVSVCVALF